MKKVIFGFLLTVVGLVFSLFCFIYAAINPWTYNGITGLLGSLLGTGLICPFIISFIIMLAGLCICGHEAFKGK